MPVHYINSYQNPVINAYLVLLDLALRVNLAAYQADLWTETESLGFMELREKDSKNKVSDQPAALGWGGLERAFGGQEWRDQFEERP